MSAGNDHHIAIIGLAGRFPGADDIDRFWKLLRDGTEGVTFPTDEELLASGVSADEMHEPGYVKAFAAMSGIRDFDASFFGYTPRDAAHTDPQIRVFLESAHSALEHAGYNPHGFSDRVGVGVYAAIGINQYRQVNLGDDGSGVSSTSGLAIGSLNNFDYLASTVSYKLDLRGPAITVSTACSSSLVGVHLACQALRNGECDMAVAGGVDIELPLGHGYQWDDGGPFSPDGHVRPFDADARGTVFSSGVAAIVLKPLAAALADGDAVWAVIRGSAVNNDGADKAGFSAPSVSGQVAMLVEAVSMAGIAPADLSFIEAHATGTQLGDPIEITALDKAFRELSEVELAPASCAVGSVKGNVGHLGHAAGVTSLIKAVLALANEQIPPTANFREANPRLDVDRTPFHVPVEPLPWPRDPERPRHAGVSSFGIGGTNAHVIVSEAPPRAAAPDDGRPRVVVWSARTETAERAYRTKLAEHLRHSVESFPDVVATLQVGRRAYPVRRAVVAADRDELVSALDSGAGVIMCAGSERPVAMMFPGQGAQQVRMAAGLHASEPAFRVAFDHCLDLFAEHGFDLWPAWSSGTDAEIAATELAQPLLFSAEYALGELWRAWGVEPAAVIGHSVGELVAATVAGVFELPDAVRLVAARAAAIAEAGPGGMIAVAAAPSAVTDLLVDGVTVAVVNSDRQTVLAGSPEGLDVVEAALAERRIAHRRLSSTRAFHSPGLLPAVARLEQVLAGMRTRAPRIPLYSAALGRLVGDEATDLAFWAGQIAAPVDFQAALSALVEADHWLLVEMGPGTTLVSIASQHAQVGPDLTACVPSLPRSAGNTDADRRAALSALARVWAEGHDVAWHAVRGADQVHRVPLPGYQYQRSVCWVDPAPRTAVAAPVESGRAPGQPAKEEAVVADTVSPFSTVSWVEAARPALVGGAAGVDCLALLPADRDAGLPTLLALQQAGLRPAIVRPGAKYAVVGREHWVRPDSREDLDRVLGDLAERGKAPRLLVHALTTAPVDRELPSAATVDDRLRTAYYSLLALVQAGVRRPVDGQQPALLVLTTNSVDVSGADPVDPVTAMLPGFARSAVKEAPGLVARLVDIGRSTPDALLAEDIALWGAHEVVALRGRRRWVADEQPFTPVPDGARGIRRHGVYLISGGFGDLGMEIALGLASTGLQPRLALLGRTIPDDGDPRIAELESFGAQVLPLACDIADRRALRRALDTVAARLGPVDGVLHLAGVAGDGMVAVRDPEASAGVFAAKVRGTLELVEALAQRHTPDFVVSFSSRAALDGLVGSADYAAANGFLDALSVELDRRGQAALSINWPSWSRVGMAARPNPASGASIWVTEIGPDNSPLLDEHRIGANRVAVLPGTGHIDLVVRAFHSEVLGEARPVHLEDIVFHQVMAAHGRRRVAVDLVPDGQRWRFEVSSTPVGGGPVVVHARGVVRAAEAEPRAVDLDQVRARISELLPEQDDPVRLFTLGPRWHNVSRTAALPGGDTSELLLDLELAEAFADEVAQHLLHPTLLDSATGSVRQPSDGHYLPFLYQSLLVHDRLPSAFSAHIRRRDTGPGAIVADIDLIARDGRVLAEIQGFTMRKVEGTGFLDSRPAEPDTNGIEPTRGVQLLQDLLRAGVRGQVAVRPFEHGAPVPIPVGALRPMPESVHAAQVVPAAPVVWPVEADPAPMITPQAALETKLTELWAEVIGDPGIGLDDDFFSLGGNSLTAVELMTLIRDRFGADLSVATLFDYPTIRHLAKGLREQGMG